MTRIAIVDGGSFVLPYDQQLILALVRRGFEVDFYASETRYNAELLQALRGAPGVTVRGFAVSGSVSARWKGVLAYAALLRALWRRRGAYATVNLQFSVLWPLELPLLFALRRRLVFTVHNAVPHGFGGQRHRPTAWIASLARTLVFVSEFTRDDFLRRYGPSDGSSPGPRHATSFAEKARVLRHGLLPVAARGEPVPYAKSACQPRALMFWSTVKPYKGVELFADLARDPAVRARGLTLEVHGAWAAELQPLRSELVDVGVQVNDSYLAPGPLQALLARDAFFLLPYREASQSGALCTLLHQGCLFICADVGDLGEFMRRHGLEGLLLRERSAAAVLACLAFFDTHRDALLQAFQAAQRACEWDAVTADADSVYRGADGRP